MSKYIYNLKSDKKDDRDFLFKDNFNISGTLPQSVDLRSKMPPVYDQLNEGSCTSQGGTCVREYMLTDKTITLSRQFLYNVERIEENSFDQDSGCQMRTIPKCIKKYGISEEKYLPYGEQNLYVKPSDEAYKNALNYTISDYHRVLNATEMKQALYQGLPILLGITVFSSFEQNVKDDGFIPMPSKYDEELGGHCVVICGYVDSKPKNKLKLLFEKITRKTSSSGYFILRNSWSAKSTSENGWGDKGYGYLPYEVFEKIKQDMWAITK